MANKPSRKDEEYFLGNSTKEAKQILKAYISEHLHDYWNSLPKELAKRHRTFVRKLIEAI